MKSPKILVYLTLTIVLIIGSFWLLKSNSTGPKPVSTSPVVPTLTAFQAHDYTYVFIGDSMTQYLGNFEDLQADFKQSYPNKKFLLLNYGYGSTNILSVEERLQKVTQHFDRDFQAVLEIPFDLIFIESFGNNPLSEFPLEEGLKKQNAALDQIVSLITKDHPRKSIVFLATIAPNRKLFGTGVVDLDSIAREKWVKERETYTQNHIKYAGEHQIPLINVFDKSKDSSGTGKLEYLNPKDYIHPSAAGIAFISHEISKFILDNKLATP